MPDHRPLSVIASEVSADIRAGNWPAKSNYAALPYLRAMADLTSITDKYGADDAKSIVLYFLANAATWRGATARRIKAELRSMAK